MLDGLIVDNFAGGGGASDGIAAGFGRHVDIAINHDPEAIAMHKANHPETLHYCQSVWKVDPVNVVAGRHVAFAWFSPDCKHFSKAKGSKPVDRNIRDLAWVVVQWAQRVRPQVIMLENVEEFRTWCDVDLNGEPVRHVPVADQASLLDDKPSKNSRKKANGNGATFELWLAALKKCGYKVEWREIRGCDYGAPTIRKRLFIIARCDGQPIVWPEPTHGPGREHPWRTAAEIIDWNLECPSIFERDRPLADNTLRRIAHGVKRFVLDAGRPFIVPVTNSTWAADRTIDADRPLPTVTTAKGGEMALVTPYVVGAGGAEYAGKPRSVEDGLGAVTVHDRKALICPTMIQTGYGEREGQAPRVLDLDKPYGTAVAGGAKAALVSAFIAKHTTGAIGRDAREPLPTVTANSFVKRPGGNAPIGIAAVHLAQHNSMPDGGIHAGHSVDGPMSTITSTGSHQALVASSIVKLRGTCAHGQPIDEPLHTVSAGGTHMADIRAFLVKYYGNEDEAHEPSNPLGTVTTKHRHALVTVEIDGEEYVIVDIGMRMLTPRELARAQGFGDHYILDPECDRKLPSGKMKRSRLPIASQVRMIGNSVNRDVAEALVRANCQAVDAMEVAA